MTTSNSFDYSQDRDTIIRGAFELCGVAIQGEDLDADDIVVANRALNVMLKSWVVHGLQVWKRRKYTINPLILDQKYYDMGMERVYSCTCQGTGASTLVIVTLPYHDFEIGDQITVSGAVDDTDINGVFTVTSSVPVDGTFTYTAGDTVDAGIDSGATTVQLSTGNQQHAETIPRPERLLEVNRINSGNRTPLTELSRNEYENLPDLTTSGTPIQYHYERNLDMGRFHIWPVADANSAANETIEIVYQTQIEDMDSSTDTLDMPQEWLEPVIYNLAYRLSQRYGMKNSSRKTLREDAMLALKLAKDYDYEDGSLFLAPELR